MRQVTAFVDERLIAGEFGTGDVVRKTGLRDFAMSPYVGRVLYSNVETGKVHVQWPWGAEQETPSELLRLDESHGMPPVTVDQGLSTWERTRHEDGKAIDKIDTKWRKSLAARAADAYEESTLPLWRAACEAWHCQMPEVETYVKMVAAFGEEYGEDAVRLTVANLYELGRHVAIYWKDKKRRYKTTQQEKDSKKFACPRCRGNLRPRVYRQGRRFLLCKTCGFSIHPKDLI